MFPCLKLDGSTYIQFVLTICVKKIFQNAFEAQKQFQLK